MYTYLHKFVLDRVPWLKINGFRGSFLVTVGSCCSTLGGGEYNSLEQCDRLVALTTQLKIRATLDSSQTQSSLGLVPRPPGIPKYVNVQVPYIKWHKSMHTFGPPNCETEILFDSMGSKPRIRRTDCMFIEKKSMYKWILNNLCCSRVTCSSKVAMRHGVWKKLLTFIVSWKQMICRIRMGLWLEWTKYQHWFYLITRHTITWTNDFFSESQFPICKAGIIMPFFQECCKD